MFVPYDFVLRIPSLGLMVNFPTRCELMQFTGLTDKNGREIYEGDILDKTDWCNGTLKKKAGSIKFDHLVDSDGYNAEIYLCWTAGNSSLADVHNEAIIIGNIYENPELLKS